MTFDLTFAEAYVGDGTVGYLDHRLIAHEIGHGSGQQCGNATLGTVFDFTNASTSMSPYRLTDIGPSGGTMTMCV